MVIRNVFLGTVFLLIAAVLPPACLANDIDNATAIAAVANAENDGRENNAALEELHRVVATTQKHAADSLVAYRDWLRAHDDHQQLLEEYPDVYPGNNAALGQLVKFNKLVNDAFSYADAALSNPDYDRTRFHDFILSALAADSRSNALAVQAVDLIADAWKNADSLAKTRDTLLAQYQDEIRRGNIGAGTRLAWGLIRIGASHSDVRVVPGSLDYSPDIAKIQLRYLGADVAIQLDAADYRERFRATVNGYNFRSGWPVLFQKPLAWMVEIAKAMQADGISPEYHNEWDVMEAPEGVIALAVSGQSKKREIPLRAYYQDALRNVSAIPMPASAGLLTEQFRTAAKALHDGIMADESISLPLRQVLEPILHGTYGSIDKRDYFDNDFCRRLIEADYLETQVENLGPERKAELEQYRQALAKIEAGIDRFAVELDDDGVLVAISRPEIDRPNGDAMDERDPETGENLSPWEWRWEKKDATVFHSPLPGRSIYAFSVLETYPGKHTARPRGVPATTEVWHAVKGKLAAYRDGDVAASGDVGRWLEAVTLDAAGRRDGNVGPLGWNFPLYVPVRDDQGDPVLIATLNGVVTSPDFNGISEGALRRAAHDQWLDTAARVLATPGELALIYQLFFRYCSDSPLPEMPNLIGSHRGLSDTHQTVHQSLERRWVGRLIGDCDDLAEFFQNLAVRQGKLSHVMQLPAHAAAGWLEDDPDGGYQFIVLQSGPALRFTADTRPAAVEKAYRHFEDEVGASHFTAAAVPLLLRFRDDDTRMAFVLSARIYWDRDYAEKMITVQSHWHLHAFSAAVKIMEEMVKTDREVGNLKELASLYEMVGDYEKSADMRDNELVAVVDDPQATLSTLLDIAYLHVRDKNKPDAMLALEAMQEKFADARADNRSLYERSTSFRSSWASLLARLGEPEQAWKFLEPDVKDAWRRDGKLSDTMLRTLVALYDRMSIQRDRAGDRDLTESETKSRQDLRAALARAFGKDYFSADDSYNKIHSRYFLLGRYGIAVTGRHAGMEALWKDGPYPEKSRAHADRTEDLNEEDWEWLRIMPRLYLAYGLEKLDKEEYPELYDPVGAERCLELIDRAILKGSGFGSNVMGRDAQIKSHLVLSFLDNDLDSYKKVMELVRDRNYSSLDDDVALVFGAYCGLIPEADFAPWLDAFHTFFPKRQHYFKAAYRALEKGYYDHGVMLAKATANFFPDDQLLVDEAAALEQSAEKLRKRQKERGWQNPEWAQKAASPNPTGDLVTVE